MEYIESLKEKVSALVFIFDKGHILGYDDSWILLTCWVYRLLYIYIYIFWSCLSSWFSIGFIQVKP